MSFSLSSPVKSNNLFICELSYNGQHGYTCKVTELDAVKKFVIEEIHNKSTEWFKKNITVDKIEKMFKNYDGTFESVKVTGVVIKAQSCFLEIVEPDGFFEEPVVPEPEPEPVPEPVAEAVTEPVAEPVAEPVPEPVPEPAAEQVSEHVETEEKDRKLYISSYVKKVKEELKNAINAEDYDKAYKLSKILNSLK